MLARKNQPILRLREWNVAADVNQQSKEAQLLNKVEVISLVLGGAPAATHQLSGLEIKDFNHETPILHNDTISIQALSSPTTSQRLAKKWSGTKDSIMRSSNVEQAAGNRFGNLSKSSSSRGLAFRRRTSRSSKVEQRADYRFEKLSKRSKRRRTRNKSGKRKQLKNGGINSRRNRPRPRSAFRNAATFYCANQLMQDHDNSVDKENEGHLKRQSGIKGGMMEPNATPDQDVGIPQVGKRELTLAMNQFALDLYLRYQTSTDATNIVAAPTSVFESLASVHLGARGDTAEEIASALSFDKFPHESLKELRSNLINSVNMSDNENTETKEVVLKIANHLFGQRGYGFKQEFFDKASDYYQAGFTEVDFMNGEVAAATINGWVRGATDGIIEKIVSSRLSPSTKLMLLNAVYFKGRWHQEFKDTENRKFVLSNGEEVQVPMMFGTIEGAWYRKDAERKCRVLGLHYKGGDVTMFIILPDEGTSLKDVESKLTAEYLLDLKMKELHEIDVYLPRFEIESEIKLEKILADLGMQSLFTGAADLSGMSTSKELSIGKMTQKATIKVDEKGTVAAAVTSTLVFDSVSNTPTFNACRPFFFFVQENGTEMILFCGRVGDPRSKS